MKWFKHDSVAHTDSKLKRLRAKYGMEGYGLYWYCLELIAKNVEAHNLTFELEEDSELIALESGIHYEIVQEMMEYMVKLGLFENVEGTIKCLKMLARTDEYTTKLIRSAGHTPDTHRINSGHTPDKIPPIRTDKNRIENKRATAKAFDEFWIAYPKKKNKGQAEKAWKKISSSTVPAIMADLSTREWPNDPQFIPYPSSYLNGKSWLDEDAPVVGQVEELL